MLIALSETQGMMAFIRSTRKGLNVTNVPGFEIQLI